MVESVDTKDLKSFGYYGCEGSSPSPTTEGVNPETLKEKVDDSLERQATLPDSIMVVQLILVQLVLVRIQVGQRKKQLRQSFLTPQSG